MPKAKNNSKGSAEQGVTYLKRQQRWDVLNALRTAIRTYHSVHGIIEAEKLPIVRRWMKLCGFVQMGDILEAAAKQFGVDVEDILTTRQDDPIVRARHVTIYLLMQRVNNRSQVARLVDRHCSLVDYALAQVENRIETEGYELPKL